MEPDQKHFHKVLGMEAPEELRGLARDGLRKIAVRGLKARGPRMDAVIYLLDGILARGQQDAASAGSTRKMDGAQARRKARERKASTQFRIYL